MSGRVSGSGSVIRMIVGRVVLEFEGADQFEQALRAVERLGAGVIVDDEDQQDLVQREGFANREDPSTSSSKPAWSQELVDRLLLAMSQKGRDVLLALEEHGQMNSGDLADKIGASRTVVGPVIAGINRWAAKKSLPEPVGIDRDALYIVASIDPHVQGFLVSRSC